MSTLVASDHDFRTVTLEVSREPLRTHGSIAWRLALAVSGSLVVLFVVSVLWLFTHGVGVFGTQMPVAWAIPITNFVWWIGIGHAGTFISAFLLLMRQSWRNAVNRIAEAMTLFAVLCAGMFPVLHLGRPQLLYFLLPYPNSMGLWPQFRSPLTWDIFAVGTYGTVSLLFWYLGLVPDLATLRDRARTVWKRRVYGLLALGWRGQDRHWHHYKIAYGLIAGLATPLVISVHSVVGLDFAVAMVPGWHDTVVPPTFVLGALFSGFAMVLTLVVPLRAGMHLEDLITLRHVANLAKLLLLTGLLVALCYGVELFVHLYEKDPHLKVTGFHQALGERAPLFAVMVLTNVLLPQLVWLRRVRESPWSLFALSIAVNVGMWLERYLIVVGSLERDYLQSSWRTFHPTLWDATTFLGSLGVFAFGFLLFARFVPVVPMHEMRELVDVHPSRRARREPSRAWTASGYGVVAEYRDPERVVAAVTALHAARHGRPEVYSPLPIEGLEEEQHRPKSRIPWLVLGGALAGAFTGFALQAYPNVWGFPLDVGGRPDFSWPSFVPITFECAVLFGSCAAFFGFLLACGLPRLVHPIFDAPGSEDVTTDRILVCVRGASPSAAPILAEHGADRIGGEPC